MGRPARHGYPGSPPVSIRRFFRVRRIGVPEYRSTMLKISVIIACQNGAHARGDPGRHRRPGAGPALGGPLRRQRLHRRLAGDFAAAAAERPAGDLAGDPCRRQARQVLCDEPRHGGGAGAGGDLLRRRLRARPRLAGGSRQCARDAPLRGRLRRVRPAEPGLGAAVPRQVRRQRDGARAHRLSALRRLQQRQHVRHDAGHVHGHGPLRRGFRVARGRGLLHPRWRSPASNSSSSPRR